MLQGKPGIKDPDAGYRDASALFAYAERTGAARSNGWPMPNHLRLCGADIISGPEWLEPSHLVTALPAG